MYKHSNILALFVILLTSLSLSILTQPVAAGMQPAGALDPNFGIGGSVSLDFSNNDDYAQDMVIGADGKVLLAGYAWNGSGRDFALARLNPDGTLDTTFGDAGKVLTDLGGNDRILSVAFDSQQRIVVAGYTLDGTGVETAAIARYTPAGVLDTTFATTGWLTYDLSGQTLNNNATGVAVTSDDQIVIGGFAYQLADGETDPQNYPVVARFAEDGTFDATFGVKVNSLNVPAGNWGQSIAVDANDHILLGVSTWFVGRLTVTGDLDVTFSDDGIQALKAGDTAHDILPLADGNILFTGSDQSVTRLLPNGEFDVTFGNEGRVVYDAEDGIAYSVAVDSKGRIITAGYYNQNSNQEFIVIRREANGALDTTFGEGGVIAMANNTDWTRARAVAADADDNLIVARHHKEAVGSFNFFVSRLLGDVSNAAGVELIINGGFEAEDLAPWTVKNATKDKVKTNKETKKFSHNGANAFMFKGGVGENSKLMQKPAVDSVSFAAGDSLSVLFYVSAKKQPAAKFKLVVKYSDDTPKGKLTGSIGKGESADYFYLPEADNDLVLASAAVSNIKLMIVNKSASGKLFIDDVSLRHVAAAVEPEVELLPLPVLGLDF